MIYTVWILRSTFQNLFVDNWNKLKYKSNTEMVAVLYRRCSSILILEHFNGTQGLSLKISKAFEVPNLKAYYMPHMSKNK